MFRSEKFTHTLEFWAFNCLMYYLNKEFFLHNIIINICFLNILTAFVAARCIINVLYVILYHMWLSIYLKENAAQKCFYVLSQYYKAPGGWCSIASDLRLPYKKGVLRKIIRIELLSLSFSMKNDKFHSNIKTIESRITFILFVGTSPNCRLCE